MTICISGIGALTSHGATAEEVGRNILGNTHQPGQAVAGSRRRFVPSAPYSLDDIAARRTELRVMGQHSHYAIYAGKAALAMANRADSPVDLDACAIIVAVSAMERLFEEDARVKERWQEFAGRKALGSVLEEIYRPTAFLAHLPNLIAFNLASALGTAHSTRTLLGSVESAGEALRESIIKLNAGEVSSVLVGASTFGGGFYSNMAVDHVRPESRLGSGGVFVLLESKQALHRRRADCAAELLDVRTLPPADLEQWLREVAPTDHEGSSVVLYSRIAGWDAGPHLERMRHVAGASNCFEHVGCDLQAVTLLQTVCHAASLAEQRRRRGEATSLRATCVAESYRGELTACVLEFPRAE